MLDRTQHLVERPDHGPRQQDRQKNGHQAEGNDDACRRRAHRIAVGQHIGQWLRQTEDEGTIIML
jgi:hypothetical protein